MPNPFTNGTRMAYAVGTAGQHVDIRVYDVAGRMVRTLVSEPRPAGRHSVAWDGRDAEGARMRKGMYFVRLQIGDDTRMVRVTFLN